MQKIENHCRGCNVFLVFMLAKLSLDFLSLLLLLLILTVLLPTDLSSSFENKSGILKCYGIPSTIHLFFKASIGVILYFGSHLKNDYKNVLKFESGILSLSFLLK